MNVPSDKELTDLDPEFFVRWNNVIRLASKETIRALIVQLEGLLED